MTPSNNYAVCTHVVIYACSVLLPAKYFKYKSCCKYLYAHSTRCLWSEQDLTKEQSVCNWRHLPTTLWKRFCCSCYGKTFSSAALWKGLFCSSGKGLSVVLLLCKFTYSIFFLLSYYDSVVKSVTNTDICLHCKLSSCFQSQLCCSYNHTSRVLPTCPWLYMLWGEALKYVCCELTG